MKNILIISNYWHFENEKSSSRYLSIAKKLSKNNKVEVITSSFYHTKKEHRKSINEEQMEGGYKVTLINEPGYRHNVTPKRIISHDILAKNILEYLKKSEKPDLIYLFVPPLTLGDRVSEYAKKNSIKLVIDVLDLWPEAFQMLIPHKNIGKILFSKSKHKAKRIYDRADGLISVSKTYLDYISLSNKTKYKEFVYIGIDLDYFDMFVKKKEESNQINIVYIGMLGHSYDLKCAIDAISILNKNGSKNLKFLVMGDGPLMGTFEDYAEEKAINYEFTGRLSYEHMIERLCQCDIALNVISAGAVQSIINKHADYLAAGLPIINNQEVAEFGDLIQEYNCGINCENSNSKALANAILKILCDDDLRIEMGENSRKVAEMYFDRNNTYSKIEEMVNEIVKS